MGFKVGDRIRVYFVDGAHNTGVITFFSERLLKYQRDICGNTYSAHPKQCRRLVKKNTISSREMFHNLCNKVQLLEKRVEDLEKPKNNKCPACGGCGKYHSDCIPQFACGACAGRGY